MNPYYYSGIPKGPLIADDAGTVAHVVFDGSTLIDSKGNAWTQNGTVPQVARSGRTPAGAGPFSDANYYSLGTGSDVLDFAGDFSACIVFAQPTNLAVAPYLFDNGNTPNLGYAADLNASGTASLFNYADNIALSTVNAAVGGVNVACIGNAGTTSLIKLNLGAIASRVYALWTPATTVQARLGRGAVIASRPFAGTIYEAWFSTTTPTDALFTAIMQQVKQRLGNTPW